jgi:hypothetical protein
MAVTYSFPELPTWELGELDTFAAPEEMRAALGNVGVGNDLRLNLALLVATRHVLHVLGYTIVGTDLYAEIPPSPDPLEIVPVPVPVATWRTATIAAAVRFYKSPEVPFGVAGGWDMATYVRQSIPDVDMMLIGERVAFGIA